MKELEDIKNIFLADDIDEETRQDNFAKIQEWESDIINNRNLLAWQEHDISKSIVVKLREAYKDISLRLLNDRAVSTEQRVSLWAKQDACLFLLGLIDMNAKSSLEQVKREISMAINATK